MAEQTLWERWAERRALLAARHHAADGRQRAGDEGEERLSKWLSDSGGDAVILRGKRVPNRRKAEIDLVVVDRRRVLVIEVKNWAGELLLRPGRWVQRRDDGSEDVHDDLAMELIGKRDAVMKALFQAGASLDRAAVVPLVVFLNPRLRIDPKLAQHPYIVTRSQLDTLGDLSGLLAEFEARVGPAEPLSSGCRAIVAATVASWRGWDRLLLYGGGELRGDLRQLTVGGHAEQLDTGGDLRPLRVEWARGRFESALQALFGQSLGHLVLPDGSVCPLSVHDTITIQPVGSPRPTVVPLTEVKTIAIG